MMHEQEETMSARELSGLQRTAADNMKALIELKEQMVK